MGNIARRRPDIETRTIASGDGWAVRDCLCRAGPRDRPFEERHGAVCVALVTDGSFQYRSSRGSALLVPGALLLGREGDSFECSHHHGTGDRCLAFHFTSETWQAMLGAPPVRPWLPPLRSLAPLLAAAEAARNTAGAARLEEIAVALAGAVHATLREGPEPPSRPVSRRDERRIGEAARFIEQRAEESISLSALAASAGMSRFHFLRLFRQLVGTTPHQFLLHVRLQRAALRLRHSSEPVSAIAFDVGFTDLSTFNSRFRQVMGVTPTAYRGARS